MDLVWSNFNLRHPRGVRLTKFYFNAKEWLKITFSHFPLDSELEKKKASFRMSDNTLSVRIYLIVKAKGANI